MAADLLVSIRMQILLTTDFCGATKIIFHTPKKYCPSVHFTRNGTIAIFVATVR